MGSLRSFIKAMWLAGWGAEPPQPEIGNIAIWGIQPRIHPDFFRLLAAYLKAKTS
jgi:hypothetical protein